MALSNYDMLAFDSNGMPCNGVLQVGSATASIYKTWLSVSDPIAFSKNTSSYREPNIGHINFGSGGIGKFRFYAEQVKTKLQQHAGFFLVTSGYGNEKVTMCGLAAMVLCIVIIG